MSHGPCNVCGVPATLTWNGNPRCRAHRDDFAVALAVNCRTCRAEVGLACKDRGHGQVHFKRVDDGMAFARRISLAQPPPQQPPPSHDHHVVHDVRRWLDENPQLSINGLIDFIDDGAYSNAHRDEIVAIRDDASLWRPGPGRRAKHFVYGRPLDWPHGPPQHDLEVLSDVVRWLDANPEAGISRLLDQRWRENTDRDRCKAIERIRDDASLWMPGPRRRARDFLYGHLKDHDMPTSPYVHSDMTVYSQGEGRLAIELSAEQALGLAAVIDLANFGNDAPQYLVELARLVRAQVDGHRAMWRRVAAEQGVRVPEDVLDQLYDLAQPQRAEP